MQELLTIAQVAEILGRHPKTIYKAVCRGELAAIRLGHRSVRFDPADIQAYIDARRIPAGV